MVMTASQIAAELQRKKNLGIAPTNQANVGAYNKLTAQSPTTSAVGSYLNSNTPTSPTPTRTPMTGTGGWRSMFGTPQPNVSAVASAVNTVKANASMDPKPTFTPYTPFEYTQANIEADPAYQAALATAKQNIQTGQNNTIANLVANGQGHSSYADTVTQQIANKELANVSNNILPQLIQQAYQRHQQDFANQNLLDQQNYGVIQDQFNNGIQEGQLTGNYTTPDQRNAISQILNLKQQAEAPGITAEQRAQLSAAADGWRDRLRAAGGNPDALGANVSLANAGQASVGQRTLAGQQFDQGVKQANLGAAIDVSNLFGRAVTPQNDYTGLFRQGANPNTPLTASGQAQQFGQDITLAGLTGTLPDGTKTTAEQQRQLENWWQQADITGTIPDQLATLYGIPKGTQTQAAKQFAQNLAIQQDQNDLAYIRENFDEANAGAGSEGSAFSPAQIIDNIRSVYTVQDPTTKKNRITADPAQREQLFLDVIDQSAGLSDAKVDSILTGLGLTKKEIAQYEKNYAGK
jgi:hypothetical protein